MKVSGRLTGRLAAWCAVLGACALAAPIRAQDPWIIAERTNLNPNEMVGITLGNGDTFPLSEELTPADALAEWVIVGKDGTRPIGVSVEDEMDLVSNPHFSDPGLYVIAAAYKPAYREKSAHAFERYLKQEEGAAAYTLRAHEGFTKDEPGREWVHKYAKHFLQVGTESSDVAQQPIGHRFELVPQSDPADWKVGDKVGFQLLLDGKPVAGHRVSANFKGRGAFNWASEARTNSGGYCFFFLRSPEMWIIRTQLIRALDKSTVTDKAEAQQADWETFYATVSFGVKPINTPLRSNLQEP